MDPDTALREINEAFKDFNDHLRQGSTPEMLGSCLARMIEHADALDEWLRKGGFPPQPIDEGEAR